MKAQGAEEEEEEEEQTSKWGSHSNFPHGSGVRGSPNAHPYCSDGGGRGYHKEECPAWIYFPLKIKVLTQRNGYG